MDDAQFKPGWPKSTFQLLGRKSFLGLSAEEHKRLRRLTAAPISGQKALSVYHEFMKDVIVSSLDELAEAERPIEFLTEIRKITFKIIMYIFLSCERGPIIDRMEEEYDKLNYGLRAMAINFPGFAYHKALKVRFIHFTTVTIILCLWFFIISVLLRHFYLVQTPQELKSSMENILGKLVYMDLCLTCLFLFFLLVAKIWCVLSSSTA